MAPEDSTPEEWRDVPGLVGRYCVSSLGRVRGPRGPMTPSITRREGRPVVSVHHPDGTRRQAYVHTLVLLAFRGPCPDGQEACHENDQPDDNRLANLRWGTRASNAADAMRNGGQPIGESHGRAKLTAERVRAIRSERAAGDPIAAIASRHGVSLGAIDSVLARRTWAHVV